MSPALNDIMGWYSEEMKSCKLPRNHEKAMDGDKIQSIVGFF